MKRKFWALLSVVAASSVLSVPIFAHHGSAAYEMGQSVTVEGAVTGFEFTNPHVIISMDGKDAKGAVQKWQGELTSPNHLTRAGWSRNTLKPGERITIIGNPAKSGANSVWIRKIMGPDGKELATGSGADN